MRQDFYQRALRIARQYSVLLDRKNKVRPGLRGQLRHLATCAEQNNWSEEEFFYRAKKTIYCTAQVRFGQLQVAFGDDVVDSHGNPVSYHVPYLPE